MSNQYNTAVGYIEHPEGKKINQMTVGEVKKYGRYLIDKTRGRADLGLPEEYGSSAQGAYQMTNDFRTDWASSLYGDDYKNKVFNKQTQDDIMRHYLSKVDDQRVYDNFQGLQKAGITPDKISQLDDNDLMEAIRATETGSGIKEGWLGARLKKNPSEEGLASSSVVVKQPEPSGLGEKLARNPSTVPSTPTAGAGTKRSVPKSTEKEDVELLSYFSPKESEGLAKKAQEEALKERQKKLSQGFSNISKSLQNMGLSGNSNLAYNTASQNTPVKSKKINGNNRLHF
jgi:hypothetical protein